MRSSHAQRIARIALNPLLLCAVFLWAVALFPASGRDDSYITFWPAYTLGEFGEITNYNGEQVEQSSSLLFVLILAGLYKLGIVEFAVAARIVSLFFGFATIVAVRRPARLSVKSAEHYGGFAALIVSTSVFVGYWSTSGMETSVAAFFGVAAARAISTALDPTVRPLVWLPRLAVWCALFTWVRPEAVVVLLCVCSGLAAAAILLRRTSAGDGSATVRSSDDVLKRAVLVLGLACMLVLILAAFRLVYFGSLFPQPVLAKSRLSLATVNAGVSYLLGHPHFWPLLILGILGSLRVLVDAVPGPHGSSVKAGLQELVVPLFAVALVAFVVLSGGDWMEQGRFLVPLVPFLALMTPAGLRTVSTGSLAKGVLALLVAANVWGIVSAHGRVPSLALWEAPASNLPAAASERYHWLERRNKVQARDFGTLHYLTDLVSGQIDRYGSVTLLTHQGGFVPYELSSQFFRRIRILEPNGLIDPTFLVCPFTKERYVGTPYGRSLPGRPVASLMGEILDLAIPACGIPWPDVAYGLGEPPPTPLLAKRGYTVIFRGCPYSSRSAVGQGQPPRSSCWVAIRDERSWPEAADDLVPCPEYNAMCAPVR